MRSGRRAAEDEDRAPERPVIGALDADPAAGGAADEAASRPPVASDVAPGRSLAELRRASRRAAPRSSARGARSASAVGRTNEPRRRPRASPSSASASAAQPELGQDRSTSTVAQITARTRGSAAGRQQARDRRSQRTARSSPQEEIRSGPTDRDEPEPLVHPPGDGVVGEHPEVRPAAAGGDRVAQDGLAHEPAQTAAPESRIACRSTTGSSPRRTSSAARPRRAPRRPGRDRRGTRPGRSRTRVSSSIAPTRSGSTANASARTSAMARAPSSAAGPRRSVEALDADARTRIRPHPTARGPGRPDRTP